MEERCWGVQWGEQWWSLCDRERSPPGTKHSRELTQAIQPPPPTHYLAFCVSLPSVPTCSCLSALLFVCFFLSSAHKDGHSAPALVGGWENATAAQILCSWDRAAVCG